jgi:7-carboxy-7-deazaguanine synthase (Cx14CxxC type)
MAYTVHEIFLTVQGEGANLGCAAVFVRFAGCNLWSGREEDRATAICRFCDTEFRGGESFADAGTLADRAAGLWPNAGGDKLVVLTGGEPLLQVDAALVQAFRAVGFRVAVETNGTQPLPCPLDWVCVSPKAGAGLVLDAADELKLVYPQPGAEPERFAAFSARHRWLSPMDGPALAANMQAAAAYCLTHPQWRLNIQAHKVWGLR